jgi:glutathione synthase/RimK-type ligase-like ATP-grasp enzyme
MHESDLLLLENRAGNRLTRSVLYNRLRFWINLRIHPSVNDFVSESQDLETSLAVTLNPAVLDRCRSVRVGLVRDSDMSPYYPKFERFLKTNGIPYGYYDIHGSGWLEAATEYQVIVWRPMSSPWELQEACEKIYVLEHFLKKDVYPSLHEIMLYENKLMQFFTLTLAGLPVIRSLATYDYAEALRWIQQARYPFVSKIRTGSGSQGVTLVRTQRMARRIVEQVFRNGRATYWPFARQKNYVLFQEFMENKGYDIRVIVADDENIFGYFRSVPRGDFRASGYGALTFAELPREAVELAVRARTALGLTNVSVDLLQSSRDGRFHIIEISQFIKIDSPSELLVKGVRGRYRYDTASQSLTFEPGRVWPQEIILKNFLESACAADRSAK